MSAAVEELVARGSAALEACDWSGAQACFEQALEREETPEAVDGLGQALYWQADYARARDLRERAYALYRRCGDRRAAALVAVRLAQLHGLIYGNGAALSGWMGHARRMLEDCGECPEQGWVELFAGCITADPGERERRCRAALELGRRLDVPGLEFDALGYVGKALIEQGAVESGMELIDEAVAATASGVVADPWAAGEIYCTLFHACEIALDVTRAEDWLQAVDAYVERTDELPIAAICRMHYGGVLAAAGRWQQAERELEQALEIYEQTYRGSRSEPLLRLADLRVRQGRLEEAERLLEGYEQQTAAALPVARLLLARGEPARAQAAVERGLPGGGPGLVQVPLLRLGVRAALAGEALAAAREHAAALTELAASTERPSVAAVAALSMARIAVAAVEEGAREHFEQALAGFAKADLVHDVATTRLELAELLAAEDRSALARGEALTALKTFQRIGAARDADAAADLLRRLGEHGRSWPRGQGELTARQREVLELLTEGLSNAEIADRLYISPRTAEHHVSNILAALGLDSRTEAAAYALRRSKEVRGGSGAGG